MNSNRLSKLFHAAALTVVLTRNVARRGASVKETIFFINTTRDFLFYYQINYYYFLKLLNTYEKPVIKNVFPAVIKERFFFLLFS